MAERTARKDRLIQTRVPREMETHLKAEAERRRLSVSQLVRNLIEDTLDLVDDVVTDVDQIVSDSVHLARNVGRNARKLASAGHRARRDDEADPAAVAAWQEVVMNRALPCSRCDTTIPRSARGYLGIADETDAAPRAWLCTECIDAL